MEPSLEIQKQRSLVEILNPRENPGIAFQSYEEFKNDAPKKKAPFIQDEVRNPELRYPYLEDPTRMEQGIESLYATIQEVVKVEPDQEKVDITITSIEFRIAEMNFVKLCGELNAAVTRRDPVEVIEELALKVRVLNEELYGKIDQDLLRSAQYEVWSQLDSKDLSASAQAVYDELSAMLPRPEEAEPLPDLNHESIKWAGEKVLSEFADIESYMREFWEEKQAAHGDDWTAQPEDIAEAFEGALTLLDSQRESGISAIVDPEASAASWETSLMAIKIGGNRAAIKTPEALFKLFMHEGGLHGVRAIYGLKSDLPIIGTGLFTNTPRPDYLAAEEGIAKLVEEMVKSTDQRWGAANLGHYLNIGLAENGADFRDVFEASWRYRLLLDIKDNDEVTEEMVSKAKDGAYTGAVRIFRGMPLQLSEVYPPLAPAYFGKDNAYLEGTKRASEVVRQLHERQDEAGVMKLFTGKYDPTISEHVAIMQKYGVEWESRHG